MKSYICLECGDKTSKYCKKSLRKKTKTVLCKKCHSLRQTNLALETRADKNPESYWSCNDCDRVSFKFNLGHIAHNKKIIRHNCLFCKSKNIEAY
jgi:RNase P subunit RPR2